MGMVESGDQIVIQYSSSIALLQERFRELQRVKEMRERREILRMLLESEKYKSTTATPTQHYEPSYSSSKFDFFQKTETILMPPPTRPPCQLVSLSLWPNLEIKHNNFMMRGVEKPEMTKSIWPTDKPLVRAPPFKFNCSDSDVDTSLHL